jgi:carbon-monoxide dehydrogenase medium subunit
VTEVRFPIPKRAAYVKFAHRASKYAVVGVFVAQTADGVRVAVTGAGQGVPVAGDGGGARRRFTAAALDGITVPPDDLVADAEASAEYRAHLCVVMAKRAVAALR